MEWRRHCAIARMESRKSASQKEKRPRKYEDRCLRTRYVINKKGRRFRAAQRAGESRSAI
jgi:hypothetical protein